MAENASAGSTNSLYFIVGGLVVAVGIGIFAYTGGYIGGSKTTTEQTTTSTPFGGITTTTTTTKP